MTAVVGLVGTVEIYSIDNADKELYENITVPLNYNGDLQVEFQKMRNVFQDGMLNKFLFSKDDSEQVAQVKELDGNMKETLANLEKTVVTDELKQALGVVKAAFDEYYTIREKLSALINECKQEEVSLLQGDVAVHGKKIGEALGRMDELMVAQAKAKSDGNTAKAN